MNIIDILRRHELEIKNRFSVRRIGLFGSFARGDEKDSSDVDIMVEFEEPTFDNFMKLAFYLEDLFNRRVELVTPDSLSPYIAPYVKSEVVWADQDDSVFLRHILDEINFLEDSSSCIEFSDLMRNREKQRAWLRSLEVIGEATKNLSKEFK